MQFIDLKAQQLRIRSELEQAYKNILDHGRYIMGPEIAELEKQLAQYTGAKHVLSCSNGTDALSLVLMAYGIEEGDAVFTTNFSFYATCETIMLCGATPVFVDIEMDTFNLSTTLLEAEIEKTIAKGELKPKAIMTVDLFGLPCDYKEIRRIADQYDLKIIEDAAQAFGGEYFGKKTCGLADVGCTSFFPAKPLGCYGDGGAVFTDDDELIEVLKSLRIHGKGSDKYDNVRVGLNARMDTVQAGVLIEKLKIFDDELQQKTKNVERYNEYLSKYVVIPKLADNYKSGIAQYCILADAKDREPLCNHLKENGIPTMVYYRKAMPYLDATKYLGYKKGDFPVAEDCSERILALPMHAYLSDEDFDKIFAAFDSYYNK